MDCLIICFSHTASRVVNTASEASTRTHTASISMQVLAPTPCDKRDE